MDFIVWIVFGALAGWVASMIAGTNAQQGLLMNVVVGVVGAFVGGWVMKQFGEQGVSGFNLYSFLVAVAGSVLLLFVYRMVTKK
ncbi:GlsB/YeaQ/YmgE family stress response membrane protein [Candidatus Saccharibacteria bacterium]|nr:GlsB/YeaQ/YmgE family stress response membrane protein [Candidatus Saccharibacteria bacterium]